MQLLSLSIYLLPALALRLPFERRDIGVKSFTATLPSHSIKSFLATSDTNSTDVGNVGNIRYTTNVTVNGKEVHVALDTGSTDLWVMPPGGIGTFNDTKIPLNLRYGDGSYGVNGTIGVSPFEFGPFKVEKQAFLSAEKSTIGGMTELGINGLFGLSFDQPDASPINHAIQTAYGATATWGASVLKNIFAQNASQPNFIAVDLARTQDLESTAGGSFNIGEYEPTYASVVSAPKIPIYPPNASRWTGLLDGITINNATVELGKSVIADTPKGKAVALFDTGSPGGVFSNAIMREIYSRIEGAAFDDVLSMWIIPCTATPEVEVVLGGQKFAIHPLDLSEFRYATISGTTYSLCINSFLGMDNINPDFDVVFGDTFLRNVYSVYDFGDFDADGSTTAPYMQFLSQISRSTVISETLDIRTAAIAANGPELPPKDLLALLNSDSSSPSTGNDLASKGNKSKTTVGGDVDLSDGSDDDASSQIARWGPVVVGLLGANLVVGLVLLGLGVINCLRRGGKADPTTKNASQVAVYTPLQNKDKDEHVGGYGGGNGYHYDTPYSQASS